ncbi:MAG: sugar ABC transporter permease [Anaerolineae bacterium]|nr:sugar ABC transporter permease [Anaerolineae bacterium]
MRAQPLHKRFFEKGTPYLYILPFFVSFAVFGLYPLLYSLQLSFSEFKFGKPLVWVGLKNFDTILSDPLFWLSLRNVIILWVGSLSVQLVVAFLLAWLLNPLASRLRGFFSGVFYLPVVMNLVAIALAFQFMFDKNFGVINLTLNLFGIESIPWLTTSQWAPISTIILIIWKGLGWYVVYILAALQSVDTTLYEAAKIDGANTLQQMIHVTLPSIRPILLFLIVLGTVAGLQIFTEPYLLFSGSSTTLGGPESSVLTPVMYIYVQGFQYLKFGPGSAIAVLLGVLIAVFSAVQFRLLQQR